MPTFVVRCYNPQRDSNFYVCLDKDQIFANLEMILPISKSRKVIIFGDINAHTRSLQLHAQQSIMLHAQRMPLRFIHPLLLKNFLNHWFSHPISR